MAFVLNIPLRKRPHSRVSVGTCRHRWLRVTPRADFNERKSTIRDLPEPTSSNKLPSERQVWSAGETPPVGARYPPGKLPLALEIDFVLNHPVTDSCILFLVIFNCLVFAAQTFDVGPGLRQVFRGYENSVSILFLLEYMGRWYGKGLSPRFLLTRGMIIDFLTVAPIGFAFADQSDALFVRMLRLIRIFRIERMVMDSENKSGVMKGMSSVQVQLASICLSLFSLLYVSAGLFFQVEKDVNPGVRNFFDAFYFSTVTLFTVGFGDVTPLTTMGRLTTVLTVLTGAVLIPFKISEVDRVRRLAKRDQDRSNLRAELDTAVDMFRTPMYRVDIECKECHLKGHQADARFCRNCGSLLLKRKFDR